MSQVIEISPVTRIEGHLGVKVEVEDGKVVRAFMSGEMFRGFERILRGRDPLDAQHITQRICGVCPVEHGVASVMAQEMAWNLTPAANGLLTRNLIQAANFIASHITHFYLLSAVDFVDVARILEYQGNDVGLKGLREWVKSQTASNTTLPAAPFLPRYAVQYLQDAETNFTALRHYLDAFDMRTLAHRMGALFAGKLPHAATLVPGGITEKVTALKIAECRAVLERLHEFIVTSYVPDVMGVAKAFPEYFDIGRTAGNYLAYGAFANQPGDAGRFLPGGVVMDGKLEPVDAGKITEDVAQSWFSSASGLMPFDGETVAAPEKSGAYSWLKAPRYNGHVMEVGPLARLHVALLEGGNAKLKTAAEGLLGAVGKPASALSSVMGRHAARALECQMVAEQCFEWLDRMNPDAPTCNDFTPSPSGRGMGLTEAARGALGHWIVVEGGKIANYQCVVPTTWNCSPRDDKGQPGAVEQAVTGIAVADVENPVEVVRVVRSFDPCLACAVH